MFLIATIAPTAALAAEPITRNSEVPELASMALLSVVLAGASMVVRRTGPKPDARGRRSGAPRP